MPPTCPLNTISKPQLRASLRQARRELTQSQQRLAAEQLLQQMLQHQLLQRATHIAVYLSNDGELACDQLIHWCWQNDKRVYLPVIHPFNHKSLVFVAYDADTNLQPNRFGIPEPTVSVQRIIPIDRLDMVCMPLVGFDQAGNRLGMGGGFYDRTFCCLTAHLNSSHWHAKTPDLFGLAHDCQQVERLLTEPWDVPLQKIVTPSRVISVV